MPCNCDGYPDEREELAQAATRAACDLATVLRSGGTLEDCSSETRKFIDRHDTIDRERLREEREKVFRDKLRKKALSKLTPEERRAIGI
jgi:hypothetical protein